MAPWALLEVVAVVDWCAEGEVKEVVCWNEVWFVKVVGVEVQEVVPWQMVEEVAVVERCIDGGVMEV